MENNQTFSLLAAAEDVRILLEKREYEACSERIRNAMYHCPDSPEPHNLMGILLDSRGEHVAAMRHYRASLDLDPTYEPAQNNLRVHSGKEIYEPRYCFSSEDCVKKHRGHLR